MGAVEPFVFRDRAGDGRYQVGEDEPLADGQLLVNGYPAPAAQTRGDGRVWLGGLSVGEPIRLAVDSASLPDAFLAPAAPEIVVQPRPGRAFRLEIPVVETGEIAGVAELVDDARREPLRGLRLQLVDESGEVRGTAVSMIDGAWLFGEAPPGRWIVRAAPDQTLHLRPRGDIPEFGPGNREWLVRMTNGVARIAVGGALQMNTSADLFDSYAATFTVSAAPP